MFYLGLHEAQSGDSAGRAERWRALEQRSPPDAPWLPTLRAEMQRVARAAGLPAPRVAGRRADRPPAGPTQDQMQAMQGLTPERAPAGDPRHGRGPRRAAARRAAGKPEDRDGWLRLANARKVLGENDKAVEAFAKADAIAPLAPAQLADWAEAHVRLIAPGAAPAPEAVAVLERLEKAEPRNALALFYLGAADLRRRATSRRRRGAGRRCWRCCRRTPRSGRCWRRRSRKPSSRHPEARGLCLLPTLRDAACGRSSG